MFGEIEWIKKHNCFAQCSLLHTAYWDHNTMPRLELTCERQIPLRCTFTSGIEFIAHVAEDYFWFSSFRCFGICFMKNQCSSNTSAIGMCSYRPRFLHIHCCTKCSTSSRLPSNWKWQCCTYYRLIVHHLGKRSRDMWCCIWLTVSKDARQTRSRTHKHIKWT